MSKIEDLIAAPIEVEFKGEKFNVEEFSIEETPALTMMFSKDIEERTIGLKKVLKIVAKKLYPSATEAQLSKIGAKHTDDLFSAMQQINSVSDSDKEELEEAKKLLTK